jgi:prepilin-type N-terminal cleavage/methylation domain-containing protein
MRNRQKGFSLIELMIVVAIILIIAAIAIPSLLSARMSAQEASAVGSLRTINSASVTYSLTYSQGFPPALANLAPSPTPDPTAADLIDEVLASGTKSGYSFVYTPGAPDASGLVDTYTINANPLSQGQTGIRYFYSDQSTVILYSTAGPAGPNDTPIG